MPEVFTIGHSNHSISQSVRLLSQHAINVVCDVRSVPYSKATPQFHREELGFSLRKHGIQYLFLGAALRARTKDPNCIVDGRVSYEEVAKSESFTRGITQVQAIAAAPALPSCVQRRTTWIAIGPSSPHDAWLQTVAPSNTYRILEPSNPTTTR